MRGRWWTQLTRFELHGLVYARDLGGSGSFDVNLAFNLKA